MVSNELFHAAQEHTYLSLVMAILYSVSRTKTHIGHESQFIRNVVNSLFGLIPWELKTESLEEPTQLDQNIRLGLDTALCTLQRAVSSPKRMF